MSSNTNVLEAYQNDMQDSKADSKANPIELSTALIAYRQAYLQCIAKCWGDEDFANDFISGPVDLNKTNSVWNNVLKNPKFLNFLPKGFQNPTPEKEEGYFPLNWRVNLYVVEKIYTDKLFSVAEYAPFNPNANNGWIGGTDLFIVKIPKKPLGLNESELATALAAYYSNFTTLFGNGQAVTDSANNEKSNFSNELCQFYSKFEINYKQYEKAITQNLANDFGDGGNESFYGFGAIIMNMISVCWENPNYLSYLTSDNRVISPVGTKNSIVKDEYVTFQNPWAFNILFKEVSDENSKWNSETQKWENIENNEVYLQFPSKPSDEKNYVRAIARYNGTGPAYPLTCP